MAKSQPPELAQIHEITPGLTAQADKMSGLIILVCFAMESFSCIYLDCPMAPRIRGGVPDGSCCWPAEELIQRDHSAAQQYLLGKNPCKRTSGGLISSVGVVVAPEGGPAGKDWVEVASAVPERGWSGKDLRSPSGATNPRRSATRRTMAIHLGE